ncbi:protein of unknown function [Nocardia cyriacigeorgica GUH-2]|uniref:Uncharacterized protein n=1 Tax=Nocardia cyriacigeorgica (strain GUH-2) TaxID=1127134 RepID=H6R748_NOCCG|nr:protein of unknown function [Nocardia cyriacigeorgica GUH-2]
MLGLLVNVLIDPAAIPVPGFISIQSTPCNS